ncbi:MAG: hypothetical protein IT372_15325 [Polyangiaceae bacterium]|nr:hypothetical protein [Polyangiaceae bacterium]
MGALAGAASIAGCGGDDSEGAGAGTTGTSQGCELTNPLCTAVDSECIALVDNRGKTTFGLRMAQLVITKPDVLAGPTVGKTVSEAVRMSLQQCHLNGTGTFSWLIEFDTTAGTARTGGALPQTDPTQGFCFVDTTVDTFHIQPIVVPAPITDGHFDADVGDLIVPIYLSDDLSGTPITLPLHQARLSEGTVSADNNCIGSYNAAGLDPDNLCLPDEAGGVYAYNNGAKLTAFITIEEADSVEVTDLGQSLCVILSGDPGTYGDGASPVSHCARDAGGVINLKGDWCAATNSAATADCNDAFALGAEFAASAVEITGICQ